MGKLATSFCAVIWLIASSSFAAQLPEGSICVSPQRLSVAKGSKSWVYLDRSVNSAGTQIWESGYGGDYEAGLFEGIFAAARVVNRPIILNSIELMSIRSDTALNRIAAQVRLANAIKIDVNQECGM